MGRFNIKKMESGERFHFAKDFGLENIRVELTFDDGDLDTHAWLLNSDGVIVNDEGFVFYNSENRSEAWDKEKFGNKKNWLKSTRPMSADGAVLGAKDELTGGIETMNIYLSKIASNVQEIAISASVYNENKTFGEYNAKITIIDEDSDEALCYYELNKDYQSEDAIVAGRFVINDDGDWEFEALGNGYNGGLQTLIDMYVEE